MITTAAVLVQADSAQAAAGVYSVSLLATLPILASGAAWIALRRASAESRVLVWRAAIAALLVLFLGRMLPLSWTAWAVPSTLAAPLVALGRIHVGVDSLGAGAAGPGNSVFAGARVVTGLLAVYLFGIVAVLAPTLIAASRLRRVAARARCVNDDQAWSDLLARAEDVGRSPRVYLSREVSVPMTWGLLRPIVVFPEAVTSWSEARRGMALIHELGHIRAHDWATRIVARVVCALYWFHPGVWWLEQRLRADSELLCDERVLAAGARRSDYAELLVDAAELISKGSCGAQPVVALAGASGLRGRLAAILSDRALARPLARRWLVVAAATSFAIAGPLSAVRLAPSRDVLTTLMHDGRWESRAYAVVGLARRADSIAVARAAAERDPNPRVRAWARYALGDVLSPR